MSAPSDKNVVITGASGGIGGALAERLAKDGMSLVSPGIVATDFGNNALGGGPDSRALPNAQSAESVAEVIAEMMQSRKADVYTVPGAREMVIQYYSVER